jgi:protein phosphatase
MIARTDAANPDTPLDEAALECLVLGPDGRPVLLALPTPTGVGPHELQRQLALRGRVDARSWAGASVCGALRAANEDTFGVGDGVWAVVDGMGAGSWAAPAACIVASALCEPGDDATRFADAASRLGTAPLAADATAVRLRIDGDGAHVAWLGDCRAGRLRDGVLSWLTTDHSLVTRMVEAGRISAAEAEHHPHRNILVRMVSTMDAEPPSMLTVPVVPGDRWVLASDGVWRAVPAEELAACILRATSLQDAVWQVLVEACHRDGSDNATVVIVAC